MKPGDHPDFFRLAPPAGRSRESSIVLDARGRFWHEGALIEHPGVARAFASWIRRHPDDGRYILSNDYDWTYITVEDAPVFVVAVSGAPPALPVLELSTGESELLDPALSWVGKDDGLYTKVRAGSLTAKFTPAAQLALAPFLPLPIPLPG
ncbi:MAG TPA: hypothetical protein VL137_10145 [Polyangiaceae bacterium]|nr:hypothetical protein [Polyangiaceae bacterium]